MTYLYDGTSVDELFVAVNRAISNGISPWYGAEANGHLLLFKTEDEARRWMTDEVELCVHEIERAEKLSVTRVAMEYLGGERIELKLSPLFQAAAPPLFRVWRIWPYVKPSLQRG